MFIDAAVLVAILCREPGFEELEKLIGSSQGPFFISPLVKFEAVLSFARARSGANSKPTPDLLRQAKAAVELLLEVIGAEEIAISSEIGDSALEASALYGKAVGHPADLNFGDCFAYACAKEKRLALCYKGSDFALTDLA
ncbi:type II toxin-antitoxin system VapC family toxin [Phyllobacterium sp. YR531]|uniref:type II toxin-antitoxin system VapC family toxin n=1 Tax=Phyllobacterium sp. YR531 TaxID=1144343 RepID=UPI00026F8779|nr:type II toxin-antitoxin system VapC family toxin [Phyllobacterium sp. YR531]EJN01379.1 hypothetical protein PMI41_03461 [Phyllobacterium sp. YR531]